ncbi:DUF6750 family protein [Rahnella aceris]
MKALHSLKNFPLFVAVKSSLFAHSARKRVACIIAGVMGTVLAPAAHADSDIAEMITNVLNGVYSLKDPIVKSSMVIGLGCLVAAVIMMISKKNNPQIKMSHILTFFVAGAFFIAIDQMASRTQKQMGLNPVSVG